MKGLAVTAALGLLGAALSTVAAASPALDELLQAAGESLPAAAPKAPGKAVKPSKEEAIRQERAEMLTLAAMSYAYTRRGSRRNPGYDIAAVIAWGVDDVSKTPDFVIDRNRNFKKQGDIHHAEVNAIRAAYQRRWRYDVPQEATDSERYDSYAKNLQDATLYTTLESCPMCATTITMAHIPKVLYCMEDPGLRDSKTRESNIGIPTKFYGRELTQRRSEIPACKAVNKLVWALMDQDPDNVYVFPAADGRSKYIRLTKYLAEQGEEVFKPAYDELTHYRVKFPRNNQKLLEALKAAVAPINSYNPKDYDSEEATPPAAAPGLAGLRAVAQRHGLQIRAQGALYDVLEDIFGKVKGNVPTPQELSAEYVGRLVRPTAPEIEEAAVFGGIEIDRDAGGARLAERAIMIAFHEMAAPVPAAFFDQDDRMTLLAKVFLMVENGRMIGNLGLPNFNADEVVLEDRGAPGRPPSAFKIRKFEDYLVVRRARLFGPGVSVEYAYFFKKAAARIPPGLAPLRR